MWLNGETCGTFIEGIPTNEPLWVLTDIYGNTAALKFIGNVLLLLWIA